MTTRRYPIDPAEVELSAIRAQGAGGQNVNKLSSAIHLRYNLHACSLPEEIRQRLLALSDQRISKDGIVVIKAQQYRTQEQNRADALLRLQELVDSVSHTPKARKATRPSYGARQRRLQGKAQRSAIKQLRGKPCE